MADDQETASSDFQAYKCYPIDGIDTVEVRNGSKVRMTGHLQKYYDRQKALYVVEMTYTPAIILSKPQIDTITVAEALALGAELEDNASTGKQYTIRGYVSSFSPYYEQYGYQNFYIADDPNSIANTNAAGGFYVFRGIPSTGTAVNKGDLVELTCAIRKYVPASGININIENSEFPVSVTVLQAASDTCIVASGTCGAHGDDLTWTLSCDSVLTISGTGAMADYPYTSSSPWFIYRTLVKILVLEEGITYIGHYFNGFVNLMSIYNYATTPQFIDPDSDSVFGGVPLTCTLYVPAESIALYQAADVWKDFYNILPIGGQPIEPTEGEFNVLYIGHDGDSISSEDITLHLPVAPVIEGFLFVGWQTVSAMLTEGIIIQAVYQAEEPTSAPAVYTNPANPAQKLIRNGNVYILRDDKVYTVTGQTVK